MDSTPISSETWPARGAEAALRELRAEIVAIERTLPNCLSSDINMHGADRSNAR